jgi:glycosyltransferase involved in cell wall biosynthesis
MRLLLTADPELPVPPALYGGIERVVADLIAGLRARGHEIGLVANPESTAQVEAFYPWPGAVSQRARDTFANARALRRAAKDFRPDVLHSFSRLMYLTPLLPGRLPKIMSYQRNPSLRTTAWARRLARGSLRFTGCSEYICSVGRAVGGDWTAIPNFVDLGKFTFQPTVAADAPLVFLSRVEPIKGADLAIRVARHSGRRLLIAGNHATDDSANGRYWREEIEPHLGKNGIEYVGPVNDVQKNELLGQAAAMLVPIQWNEPFGIVFAESLACGTPVVSCPRGALPEIVRPGIEGFLAEAEDQLIEAVGRLGEIDRRACRARVEAEFSADRVVERYESLYQAVAGHRTGVPAAAGFPG